MGCLRVLLAIIFPPLAVIDKGCGSFCIVLLLSLFGWIPGVIAALIICQGDDGNANPVYVNVHNSANSYSHSGQAHDSPSRLVRSSPEYEVLDEATISGRPRGKKRGVLLPVALCLLLVVTVTAGLVVYLLEDSEREHAIALSKSGKIAEAASYVWERISERTGITGSKPNLRHPRKDEARIWRQVSSAAPWTGRCGQQTAFFRNKLWVFGGMDHRGKVLNDVWASSDGMTWTCISTSAPWAGRSRHAVIVFNERLWLIGGGDGGTNIFSDVWSSLDGESWNQVLSHAPFSARSGHACVVYKDKLWLLGGFAGSTTNMRDVFSSSDGKNWIQVASTAPWAGRACHAAVVLGAEILVLGGGQGGTPGFNDVWATSDGINWKQRSKSAPWMARQGMGAVIFDGQVWILGGIHLGGPIVFCEDVWASPDGISWTRQPHPEWLGRSEPAALVAHDSIWVLGGSTSLTAVTNEVWSLGGKVP